MFPNKSLFPLGAQRHVEPACQLVQTDTEALRQCYTVSREMKDSPFLVDAADASEAGERIAAGGDEFQGAVQANRVIITKTCFAPVARSPF